jgi:drug/metabolite transporter (DMT)-like permease
MAGLQRIAARAVAVGVIVALLGGVARADDVTLAHGRRKQNAGAALIIIGSAMIIGGGALAFAALLITSPGDNHIDHPMEYGGLAMLGAGAIGLGIGIPVYISGTADVDAARAAPATAPAPATASLLRVQF